ncbi:AsmA-like C-terminal region-containing protein [Halomonas saccharevitans]|uniref:AsmA-like C-terminal region-containing protein n=1 Tax=Halomonas saccharevitans TaxID=416872 RepID=A0ABU3NIN2_9GAMM|nr:AsmA-like C-terminal region-containing protein [Halomonas saccharevitans]MDT8880358.1 AsmA-like C-terminal region-containing protein [Halomonas saccharevitans]
MSVTRLILRWLLTLMAVPLALLAVLVVVLRLLPLLLDEQTAPLERLLSTRFNAVVALDDVTAGLAQLDPFLEVEGLTIRSREGLGHAPLLQVERARLRLDSSASLAAGLPRVAAARLQGVTVHLYQDQAGRWQWPNPAQLPPELIPERTFDLDRLDFWVGMLLRQSAWVEDVSLVLHGRKQRAVLKAPRLVMTGDERRTHLEGEVFVEGQEAHAIRAVMELQPGPSGLGDFSAALQADMRLQSLVALSEVLGYGSALRLETVSGDARLWGRWHRGALADLRVDLAAPLLALGQRGSSAEEATQAIVLKQAAASAQWLREESGWQAWIETEAQSADWSRPEGQRDDAGPALPRYWQMRSRDDGWWLTTSEFDLGALAAWRDRLPLPEALVRVIESLDPQGRVTGLALGREDGHWRARAAATEVAVSPWEQAPGGGPLDVWVESEDLSGHVEFTGRDARLHFPEVFGAPMALSRASGVIDWAYDGPRSFVSGRDLEVEWNGARIEGGFGLSIGGERRGGFGLQLDFADVDAVDTPLTDWLPVGILPPALTGWLADGAAGRVPEGALRLHVPVAPEGQSIDPTLQLDLEVVEGRLPIAPGWPVLEGINGRLSMIDETLTARVEAAESLGVEATAGEVTLEGERLAVTAKLATSATALRRYLLALPVEGMQALADWRAEGRAAGSLDLAMNLDAPESLALDIETEADFSRLVHEPLRLAFERIEGPLAWRQRGEQGGLEGRVSARLLGGPVVAEIDTRAGGLDLSGTAEAPALAAWSGVPALETLIAGRLPWQGRLSIGEAGASLRLDSRLEGLAIDLPAPLGKSREARRPLRLTFDLTQGRLEGRLGDRLGLRWRAPAGGGQGRGQVWLGHLTAPDWAGRPGWAVAAYLPRLAVAPWGRALTPLMAAAEPSSAGGASTALSALTFETDCLQVDERCLGSLSLEGSAAAAGWRLAVDGSLAGGRLSYRPGLAAPLDIALDRLSLDALVPPATDGGQLLKELALPVEAAPLPAGLAALPDGRLRIADLAWRGARLGSFDGRWHATSDRLVIDPLSLALGEIEARGQLIWEASGPGDSLTRARLDLNGGDLGSALAALDQPVAVKSAETRVNSQLAWPGAPWQFALPRSQGSLEVTMRDGRFINLESPSARVVGLLNVDNLLRRLRLDFSDVTGRGTAFDRVSGAATLYGGVLETRGPVEIEGPATHFTLNGSVDLARRELDQRLSVTVPVSNNLPLAAVLAGAPMVGGALFIADKLFGDAIDRVTRIHYRVQGPWTSPRIALESAE